MASILPRPQCVKSLRLEAVASSSWYYNVYHSIDHQQVHELFIQICLYMYICIYSICIFHPQNEAWEHNWMYLILPRVKPPEMWPPATAVIWTNAEPVHWRIYLTLGEDELNKLPAAANLHLTQWRSLHGGKSNPLLEIKSEYSIVPCTELNKGIVSYIWFKL